MSIPITDKFKPKGTGGYALIDAADVEMPDGTRLSDFKGGVTSVNGQTGDVNITVTNGKDGEDGKDGKDGINGKDGTNGKDGVSPVVSISKTGKVTTITITDATGTHTATISDGEDGEDGQGASITLDTTLSKAGQAADAGAVGAAFQQATTDITLSLQFLQSAIPTTDSINALIDSKLGVIENGSY